MAIRLTVDGTEIVLDERNIDTVQYISDTPDDADARAAKYAVTVIITGRIIPPSGKLGEAGDDTLKLAHWSNIPSSNKDAYKVMVIEAVADGSVVRKTTFKQAFVVDYTENFSASTGNGTFEIKIRQKSNAIDENNVSVEGGYAVE